MSTVKREMKRESTVKEEGLLALTQSVIYEEMNTAGINQSQLAKRMGVSRSFVHRMLNGSVFITLRTFARALEACGSEVTKISVR